MLDLAQLLPHCKRDAKLDTKTDRGVINEVADMKVCLCAILFIGCFVLSSAVIDHSAGRFRDAAVYCSLKPGSEKTCTFGLPERQMAPQSNSTVKMVSLLICCTHEPYRIAGRHCAT